MWLGIDIGTSAVKVILVDDQAQVLAETSRSYPVSRPQPLWSEQDAEDWWVAVQSAAADLARQAPQAWRAVRGIGLSGQMHGAVLLGADDRPIRPVILWNDGRSHAEAEELHRLHPALAAKVGVLPMPGLTAPKIPWLRKHEPAVLDKLRMLLLPKDYIRLKLTGGRVTDMSDAAGTWMLDQAARNWSMDAISAVGLAPEELPGLVEGSDPSGVLRPEIADAWGLDRGIVIAGGAGDCAAAGVGVGVIAPGQALISLGTSGLVFAPTATYRPSVETAVHAFCHAIPDRWFQMGAILNGASAFGWAAGFTGVEVGELARRAAEAYRGASDLMVLPYLTGERTPHNDAHARGVVMGLTPETGAADLAIGVLEGVAYTLADARDALTGSGTVIDALGLVGGGARNALWPRIIASVLDRPILSWQGADKGPAFGAAFLARMAATGARPEDVSRAPVVEAEVLPEPALVEAYSERLGRFRRLYRLLKPEFRH